MRILWLKRQQMKKCLHTMINTADVTMLRTLEGIGEKTAQLIIDYRDKNGKFNSVDDLKNIKGLGDKKIDKIRNDICVK